MDGGECSGHASVDNNDAMYIKLQADIKEELPDDTDYDAAAAADSRLSDVETEDDDDVIIVDPEKTMQYLSGMLSHQPVISNCMTKYNV